MTLTIGYAATSTGVFTLAGDEPVEITKVGHASITWNDATKKLDIAAGLAVGTYPVVLTASNGVAPNATHTFTLTVTTPPTSADEIFASDLKIFPNPFTDEVRITGVSGSTLRVVNSAGATVHLQIIESADETVRLGHPAGAYVFVFEKEGKSRTVVVVKE